MKLQMERAGKEGGEKHDAAQIELDDHKEQLALEKAQKTELISHKESLSFQLTAMSVELTAKIDQLTASVAQLEGEVLVLTATNEAHALEKEKLTEDMLELEFVKQKLDGEIRTLRSAAAAHKTREVFLNTKMSTLDTGSPGSPPKTHDATVPPCERALTEEEETDLPGLIQLEAHPTLSSSSGEGGGILGLLTGLYPFSSPSK